MMRLSKRVIRQVIKTAKAGQGTGRRKSFRVGACLFKRGKVISAKPNSMKSHPFVAFHARHPYLHAETNCIISHGLDHCRGLDLVVTRVLLDDTVSCAKPCFECMRIIKYAGIRRVWYSDWNGEFKCL